MAKSKQKKLQLTPNKNIRNNGGKANKSFARNGNNETNQTNNRSKNTIFGPSVVKYLFMVSAFKMPVKKKKYINNSCVYSMRIVFMGKCNESKKYSHIYRQAYLLTEEKKTNEFINWFFVFRGKA